VTNRSDRPGASPGNARRAALPAAASPARSPSKHSVGSGTSRHASASCASVSAVPIGATASVTPACASATPSIYPSTMNSRPAARAAAAARSRFHSSRPLSNSGVSGEFRYLGLKSPSARPPNPTVRPRASRIGNISRLRNRSNAGPPSSGKIDSPASTSRSAPTLACNAPVSPLRASGANPIPNVRAVSGDTPRRVRYARAPAPSLAHNRSANHAAAASVASRKVAARSAFSRACGVSSGTSMPAAAANSFTASRKLSPCFSVSQRTASPCTPQPKQ